MTPKRLVLIAVGITYAILAIYNLLRITPRELTTDHRLVVALVHQTPVRKQADSEFESLPPSHEICLVFSMTYSTG